MKKSLNMLGGLLLVPIAAYVGNICGFQDFSHIFHHNPDSNIFHDAEPTQFSLSLGKIFHKISSSLFIQASQCVQTDVKALVGVLFFNYMV